MLHIVKAFFLRIRHSRDGRNLIENFGYLSLLQIAVYLFPIITIPYLARVLGVEGIGKIAFASAVIVWIQTIADWGFNMTGARDVAQNRDDKEKVISVFSDIFWARIFITLCSFLVLVILIIIIPKFRINALVILFTFLYVPGHILFPTWLFLGLEKMKYSSMLNVLSKLISTLLVFVIIKDKDDYLLQPLLSAFGFFIAGGIASYTIFAKWKYRLLRPSWKRIQHSIKTSADVFLNNLMPNLYNNFTTLLLGIWCGDTANGIYYAGRKFGQVSVTLMNTVATVTFPYFSRKMTNHSLYAKITLGISGLGSLLLFVLAPWIIKIFFGTGYEEAVTVARITAFALFFVAMDSIYGQNYLIVTHREKLLRNLTLVASIIGFAIAFPLIYYFSYKGAATTYMVSSFLVGSLPMYFALKLKKSKNDSFRNANAEGKFACTMPSQERERVNKQ